MYYVLTKKKLIIYSVAILGILTVIFSSIAYASGSTSWGLCFREANAVPEGNATAEELKEYNAYYIGDCTSKNIYLTFDVGYEAGYTESILDTLKKNDVKAAFFIVGNYFKTNADTVKRMDEEGHIVANHTKTHPDMSKYTSIDEFINETKPVEDLCKEITGKEMKKYYRPPQGIFSTTNLEMAKSLGYKTIFWSVAYVDWKQDSQPDPAKALETLKKRVHDGAIILLHSTSKTNAEILDKFILSLKEQGYTFRTLEELP